jgi:pyruvate/2-oxoacid:ferredoxin oxidoreductase alpha subunit
MTIKAKNTASSLKHIRLTSHKGIHRAHYESIRTTIRNLIYKYGNRESSLDEVREIIKKAVKKSNETLSDSVRKLREEI